MSSLEDRFWAKVDRKGPGECWLWSGSTEARGKYGKFRVGSRLQRAHRVAYELGVGPIPEGLVIDHLCRVTLCVNPAHMEPVAQKENAARGEGVCAVNARKTKCPQGHDLTDPANVRIWRGRRECRGCDSERCRQRREAKLAEQTKAVAS